MSGRVGEGIDDLQEFDDRPRPAMRQDDRERVLVRRSDVDQVEAEPVDLRSKLGKRVEAPL
jgi:hypothetical protein